MNAVTVSLAVAAAGWAGGALLGPLARSRAGLRAAAGTGAVGGLAALVGGCALAVHPRTIDIVVTPATTVGSLLLRATPLAAVFIALLGLVSLGIGAYTPRYHRAGRGSGLYLPIYHLALLACLGVLLAGNVTTFLVTWESMALLAYLLILRYQDRPEVGRGAFWFLALSEAGFAFIVAAFVLLAAHTGSTDLAVIAQRAHTVPAAWRTAAYLCALIGFGFKAGVVPLHVWLPHAHPVAPADGSALLSGLVVKLGAYGIALFGFQLLAPGPVWWGLLTMGVGALTAVIGILYALTERDIKRFLAYSTVENIGIIVTAFGAGMTFRGYGNGDLGAFLLLAGLYHVANHGTYKTLLFLEAGVVEHATGTQDMDRLGGLIRRLPATSVTTLIGTLGIAALPPLNGFVSEWLIFQGLFQGFRVPSHLAGILMVVAAACLGLTGGLAINAFARGYGIPFLGMPRTRQAAHATERGQPTAGPALLAAACIALGVGAPAVLTGLDRVVAAATGTQLHTKLLVGNLTVIPAHTDFSAFSPTYLAAFLLAVAAVPLLIYFASRPHGADRLAPVWDGGIVTFRPRMQYSAMTFAAPVRVTFSGVYQPSVHLERASDDPAGRSGPVHYESTVTPLFERWLYRPIVRAVQAVADVVRPIQNGDVNLYLLYVFLAVLAAYLLY